MLGFSSAGSLGLFQDTIKAQFSRVGRQTVSKPPPISDATRISYAARPKQQKAEAGLAGGGEVPFSIRRRSGCSTARRERGAGCRGWQQPGEARRPGTSTRTRGSRGGSPIALGAARVPGDALAPGG